MMNEFRKNTFFKVKINDILLKKILFSISSIHETFKPSLKYLKTYQLKSNYVTITHEKQNIGYYDEEIKLLAMKNERNNQDGGKLRSLALLIGWLH